MNPDRGVVLALALSALTALAPLRAAAKLVPDGALVPVAVEISGRLYQYYPVSADRPLEFTVEGPASFEAIARWRFDGTAGWDAGADEGMGRAGDSVDVEVELTLDGQPRTRHVFRTTLSTAAYPDEPGARAGRATRLTLDGGVPAGTHVVRVALVRPSDGVLDVNPLSTPAVRRVARFVGEVVLGAAYDSNIFRYSDADIDDFLDGARPERFPMESVDDVRFEPDVNVSFVREEPGVRSTTLSLETDLRLAAVNHEKSFAKLALGLLERHDGVAYLSLRYEAIPDYHVRALWDADAADQGGAYRPCSFAKQGFGAELGSDRSLPIDLAAHWKYEEYRYDPEFVEYDARAVTVGVRGTVRPRRGLRLDIGYALRQSAAKGYDEPGETRGTSDESDTSYDQDQYELRARWEAGRLWGRSAVVSFRGAAARRFYLTEKSRVDDPYHAGRDDTYVTVGAGVEVRIASAARLEFFAERRTREAHSDAVPDIGWTKDFEATRVGLRLSLEAAHDLD
jgi:hypothetical protein